MDVSGTIGAILNQKSREIFSVSPDATVFEAIELMDTKNVGALLVMDGQRLLGIISERDYTRKILLRGKRSRETKVAEIMSTQCDHHASRASRSRTCLRLMTDKHIRHLPVVDGDKVVGVISIGDLVKHVISCQQAQPSPIWKTTSTADSPRDRRLVGRPCADANLTAPFHRNALQLPNRFPADDRPHRAAFQFPAVERRIARGRFEIDRP